MAMPSFLEEDTTLIDVNRDDPSSSSEGGGSDGDDKSILAHEIESKKPPTYSRFTQQELPACKPIITPKLVIVSFTLIGFLFIPIGKTALSASNNVVEIAKRYDMECIPEIYSNNILHYIQSVGTNKTCTVKFTVPKHMKGPVFIYYQLTNFYQNYRKMSYGVPLRSRIKDTKYMGSRSDRQLTSKAYEGAELEKCEPLEKVGEEPIVPCGLVAWSMFNDTYSFSVKDKALIVNKTNIAWESDKETRFGSDVYPKNFQTGDVIGGAKLNSSIPLSEQEDLMVWMRTATLRNFRKLYGRIDVDLEANDEIAVEIQNNYNSYGYGGEKLLVLSTTSAFGGQNKFLGVAYLTVGGFCFFFAIIFAIIYHFKRREIGDTAYLSWNRNPVGYYMK
ncbi:unnamed protein product [Dovyalis caffra]|uniref:ALA-interacting subunit n=1 Tax=Dovyalis caffra TaxID=77055 RepID=A0AAV1SJC8_9ROSI|nr:unnamed protein product [Dovyalis caffra]